MYSIDLSKGLINSGNWNRIKQTMQKAKRGEPITTAFLGGSITQGCLASKQKLCYANRVHSWWVNKFPESGIEFINAGIGGTTSQFGVSRVRDHVLCNQPDFILAEFAVNDDNTEFFKETYEGLVRRILSDVDRPALLLMNNVRFDDGINAEDMHLPVAKHYEVPMVSMKPTIWEAIKAGEIIATDITEDFLHPNDLGHELIANVIIDFLEKVYASLDEECAPASYDVAINDILLPEPITQNAYENSSRVKKYTMRDYEVTLNGFNLDMKHKQGFLDIFTGGYEASKVGDSISLVAECTGIAVQYKKTINKPAPIAYAVVDGDEEHPIVLDANFDEDWGDCLFIETVAKHMELGKHKVEITIKETHEDDQLPFYLVSLIVSK